MQNSHFNIKIFGIVQGVNFRFFAKIRADELDIKGFVRNEPDDGVFIEAEGEKEALDKFIQWCKTGPSSAKITEVKIEEGDYKNLKEFSIV